MSNLRDFFTVIRSLGGLVETCNTQNKFFDPSSSTLEQPWSKLSFRGPKGERLRVEVEKATCGLYYDVYFVIGTRHDSFYDGDCNPARFYTDLTAQDVVDALVSSGPVYYTGCEYSLDNKNFGSVRFYDGDCNPARFYGFELFDTYSWCRVGGKHDSR
jgi:hypothetical protein